MGRPSTMICCNGPVLCLNSAQAQNHFRLLLWEYEAEHICYSALLHQQPISGRCVRGRLYNTYSLEAIEPKSLPLLGPFRVRDQHLWWLCVCIRLFVSHPHLVDSAKSSLFNNSWSTLRYSTAPLLASNIHYAQTRKGHCGLKVNMNAEWPSNPEVAGCFSNIVPGSADWHVAC